MSAGTVIVISVASATVASAVAEGIMNSLGRQTEAAMLSLSTKSLISVTALVTFAKVIKALGGL